MDLAEGEADQGSPGECGPEAGFAQDGEGEGVEEADCGGGDRREGEDEEGVVDCDCCCGWGYLAGVEEEGGVFVGDKGCGGGCFLLRGW